MKKRDIEILRIVTLRGPNIWTYRPVLEAWVDIGLLEDCPSNLLPGFPQRLEAWLPTLIEHRCSPGVRGGFLQRLHEGTWPGHILEHVTLELQNLAGLPGGFGKARETSERGVYKVIVRAWHEEVTRAALYAARDLVMAAIEDRPYDVNAAIERLREMTDSLCLGPSTACIVDGADDRDIPAVRLSTGNLVQLGYGARQRRIWTAETDNTSAIAESISRDKDLTKQLLANCGVPVPEGRLVESADDAWDTAQAIGLPVVLKPSDGNHGRGVFTNLTTREEIDAAYAIAVDEGSGVIVERFIPGIEHRLLVVGDKLVAAARGESAEVVGDGVSTVRQLVESQINTDPRRGRNEDQPLNLIRLDSAAMLELGRQRLTPDSVPAAGRAVLIQRNGNVAFDVTAQVHPEVARIAALAARVVGLDIAGIDLVAQDISRPLADQRGAIVEVNAGPGLLMHIKPAQGEAQPVGRAIVDHLFPQDDTGRIPVVGITGTNGKTVVAKIVARLLHLNGLLTGLACSDGMYLDNRRVKAGDAGNWTDGLRVLLNRAVQAAVIENDSNVILTQGMAYDRCQVGIVTGTQHPDHLGRHDILDAEQMLKVYRCQVDVVLPEGAAILDALDPASEELAELCDGKTYFFSTDAQAPLLAAHRAAGGRAVVARDGWLVLLDGESEQPLTRLSAIPITYGARVRFQIANVLAAAAAGWALGLTPALIRAGLEAFDRDFSDIPGRYTVFEWQGATVIVDDAQNEAGVAALVEAQAQFSAGHRSIIFGAGTDRRDDALIQMGRLLGETFDHITLYDDASVRSERVHGEARALLRDGIARAARRPTVTDAADHGATVDSALSALQAGHLLVLQCEEASAAATVDRVRQWISQSSTQTA
ncbi:Cyanophycin synthase [plant metagenome]|uniref:Cyanophycin synthetase n=1 Tax=plant metagenome TaxID=1297885 RepID=A0A484RJJ9_9ZZZZ